MESFCQEEDKSQTQTEYETECWFVKINPVSGPHHHWDSEPFTASLCYSGYLCRERGFVSVSAPVKQIGRAEWESSRPVGM